MLPKHFQSTSVQRQAKGVSPHRNRASIPKTVKLRSKTVRERGKAHPSCPLGSGWDLLWSAVKQPKNKASRREIYLYHKHAVTGRSAQTACPLLLIQKNEQLALAPHKSTVRARENILCHRCLPATAPSSPSFASPKMKRRQQGGVLIKVLLLRSAGLAAAPLHVRCRHRPLPPNHSRSQNRR